MTDITQIASRRRAKGLTQAALAVQAGVSISLVQKLEQGVLRNPTLKVIERIETVLGGLPAKSIVKCSCKKKAARTPSVID